MNNVGFFLLNSLPAVIHDFSEPKSLLRVSSIGDEPRIGYVLHGTPSNDSLSEWGLYPVRERIGTLTNFH